MHEWAAGELGLPIVPARSTDVYAAYLRWCRVNGEARPRPSNQFHGAVSRLAGWAKKQARIYPGGDFSKDTTPAHVLFPPDHLIHKDDAQKAESMAAWLTNSVEKFADGLKESPLRASA
jgi:hypothetical protein